MAVPDEIQRVLHEWARDRLRTSLCALAFASLSDPDGSSRTGVEMLHTAADWLTWNLARTAIEIAQRCEMPPGLRTRCNSTVVVAEQAAQAALRGVLYAGGGHCQLSTRSATKSSAVVVSRT